MKILQGLSILLASLVSTDAQCVLAQSLFDYVKGSADLSTLSDLLVVAGLEEAFSVEGTVYTLFTPSNAAFANFDQSFFAKLQRAEYQYHLIMLLKYHSIPGQQLNAMNFFVGQQLTTMDTTPISISSIDPVTIVDYSRQGSQVTTADVGRCNGVAHHVGSVLSPYWISNSIMDIVRLSPEHSVVYNFLQKTGLSTVLSSGEYTVFLPTNTAFRKLSLKVQAFLTNDRYLSELTRHLMGHVVPGISAFSTWRAGQNLKTALDDVTIRVFPLLNMVENASNLGETLANNGIIYSIDKVLLCQGTKKKQCDTYPCCKYKKGKCTNAKSCDHCKMLDSSCTGKETLIEAGNCCEVNAKKKMCEAPNKKCRLAKFTRKRKKSG